MSFTEMKQVVDTPHSPLGITIADDATYSNCRRGDHLDVDPLPSERREHSGRDVGLVHQPRADDAYLRNVFIRKYVFSADFVSNIFERRLSGT